MVTKQRACFFRSRRKKTVGSESKYSLPGSIQFRAGETIISFVWLRMKRREEREREDEDNDTEEKRLDSAINKIDQSNK